MAFGICSVNLLHTEKISMCSNTEYQVTGYFAIKYRAAYILRTLTIFLSLICNIVTGFENERLIWWKVNEGYMNDQMWSTLKKVYSKNSLLEKQSGFQISRLQQSTLNSLNRVNCTLWADLSKSSVCFMRNFLLKVLQSLVFTYTYYIWCEVIFDFINIIFRVFSF